MTCHRTGDGAKNEARTAVFASKIGQVVSRDEILDTVWGQDQFPSSRTVDNFIVGFRKLFETDQRNPQFFHSVRGVGYKFVKS